MKAPDLTGQRFGKLTVTARAPNSGSSSRWHCDCDCGTKGRTIYGQHLRSGRTMSCGCRRSVNFVANLKAGTARWNANRKRERSAPVDVGPDLDPLIAAAREWWARNGDAEAGA